VGNISKAIQLLQARLKDLELQEVSSTPQEVCDQREEIAKSVVERFRELNLKCKKLSD
jgi:hypothetical protein